ncbi:MAG: glycosyltransferase family 2 protein, partial [Chitinophagaceae bacterium]
IIIINNPVNKGFASASNQGLMQARGKFMLFLNPDTILSEDCLLNCIGFLESNSEAGACGVHMLDGSGKFLPESKRAFPSLQTAFYKLTGLSRAFPLSKRFANYYLGNLDENFNHQVDVLSGAFFMIKREVLDKTGGFDEQFFMYGEDIDLSYRIGQAGYKNYYLAENRIIHFKGESTQKGSFNYVKLFYNAMSIFVKKHYKQKNRLRPLIELFIWLRAGLTAMTNVRAPRSERSKKAMINTMIVGSNAERRAVILLLGKQHPVRNITELDPEIEWEYIASLQRPDEIIFCQGQLSFKQIINNIQRMPAGMSVKIHAKKSFSIVGSSSKNERGDVIA